MQIAAKIAIISHYWISTRTETMGVVRKTRDVEIDGDSVFDDAAALIALAQKSFDKVAKAEISKNDSLGIPTHGAVGRILMARQPPKTDLSDKL
ncbi:MAG: hypothetical protein HQL74_07750 [Magnetococcales bacterium]|nr:hypothetical protein [Magnetococcales bacterium]